MRKNHTAPEPAPEPPPASMIRRGAVTTDLIYSWEGDDFRTPEAAAKHYQMAPGEVLTLAVAEVRPLGDQHWLVTHDGLKEIHDDE